MTTITDDLYIGESVVVEFDYTGELTAPASAVITVTPVNGTDAGAASMLDGAAQISGAKVYQRVQPGVAGLNYLLHCLATQGSDKRVRFGVLPVRAASA